MLAAVPAVAEARGASREIVYERCPKPFFRETAAISRSFARSRLAEIRRCFSIEGQSWPELTHARGLRLDEHSRRVIFPPDVFNARTLHGAKAYLRLAPFLAAEIRQMA